MFTIQLTLYGGDMMAMPKLVDGSFNPEVALQDLTRHPQKDAVND